MATPGPIKRVEQAVTGLIKLPLGVVKYAAAEPLFTGSLLFALTRAPEKYRLKLLSLLQERGLSAARIATLVKSLKYLLAIGVARRANQALNNLALNYWHLRKPGAPFQFGARKEEIVLITGGCSGFGYEMVKSFSKFARVVIFDVLPMPAELEKLPGVHYYKVDLTDFPAIESAAEQVRREHGDPSVLINNAGIATKGTILEAEAKSTEAIFKVNIASHFILIKEFLPGMLRANKGHIVTIASMASFVAASGLVDYCCTKVAALYLNDGLRAELQYRYPNGTSIQTTSVHPSWHRTGIVSGLEEKLEAHGLRLDPATNVSNAVVDQVLAARSGRIFMPRGEVGKSRVRTWPLWLQDAATYSQRAMSRFEF
ncbi:hypothetical protein B0A52_00859 [Exophiala mesophila]|uniref:Short-chain dehydrogenase/reductase 2 n=1 Tax=Exophiala mesophila TaxID=212818 RepID=A0A438NIF3_EXOME|nr:hypothetical protein B0A52_00859 [Exophiala mesophila]